MEVEQNQENATIFSLGVVKNKVESFKNLKFEIVELSDVGMIDFDGRKIQAKELEILNLDELSLEELEIMKECQLPIQFRSSHSNKLKSKQTQIASNAKKTKKRKRKSKPKPTNKNQKHDDNLTTDQMEIDNLEKKQGEKIQLNQLVQVYFEHDQQDQEKITLKFLPVETSMPNGIAPHQQQNLQQQNLQQNQQWFQGYDENLGCFYYYDSVSGISQWEQPLNLQFVPFNAEIQDFQNGLNQKNFELETLQQDVKQDESQDVVMEQQDSVQPNQSVQGQQNSGSLHNSEKQRLLEKFVDLEGDETGDRLQKQQLQQQQQLYEYSKQNENENVLQNEFSEWNLANLFSINNTDQMKNEQSFKDTQVLQNENCTDLTMQNIDEKQKLSEKNLQQQNQIINQNISNIDALQTPADLRTNLPRGIAKYWFQRYSLFSKFDEGIQMDDESWYSVTPEILSIHHAQKLKCDFIIDGFCGVGGNTIQFGKTCKYVMGVDIDKKKLTMGQSNSKIYKDQNNIQFVCGDFFQILRQLGQKADVIFLSPPWGGPSYMKKEVYDLNLFIDDINCSIFQLIQKCLLFSNQKFVFFLPRNSNLSQLSDCIVEKGVSSVEINIINGLIKGLSVYIERQG